MRHRHTDGRSYVAARVYVVARCGIAGPCRHAVIDKRAPDDDDDDDPAGDVIVFTCAVSGLTIYYGIYTAL